jgi:hypothetical protein
MNDPMEIIEELAIVEACLKMNFFSEELLIEFSDEMIEKEGSPDQLYLDLSSSSKDKNAIISKLGALISANRSLIDTKKLLSILSCLYQQKQLNFESIVTLLYMLNNEFEFGASVSNEIHWLDDEYHLVSNRHVKKTIEELETEAAAFLLRQEDNSLSLLFFRTRDPYSS